MGDPLTVMFGPKPCRRCGRDHYKGACPEPPPFAARDVERVYVHLGRFVAERRRVLGLTQQDVADAMGLSRPSVTNIEAGRQRVLLHDALALAVMLGAQEAVQPLYDALHHPTATPPSEPASAGPCSPAPPIHQDETNHD